MGAWLSHQAQQWCIPVLDESQLESIQQRVAEQINELAGGNEVSNMNSSLRSASLLVILPAGDITSAGPLVSSDSWAPSWEN